MKITKSKLKEIIREVIDEALDPVDTDEVEPEDDFEDR